ncbi:MAG: hypothetical protein RIS47_796, partial [Bacteroidota bacterium]
MVTPAALMAATPVGATTTIRLLHDWRKWYRKVVLPVPALPVRNMFRLVNRAKSSAIESASLVW